MKDRSKTFSKIRAVAIAMAIMFLFYGYAEVRSRQEAEEKVTAEKRQEERLLEEKVYLDMATKYNAITGWEDELHPGNIFTIHLQNALTNTDERPYLFFARLDDIRETGERHEVVLSSYYSYDFEPFKPPPYIYLYLSCNESLGNRIMKEVGDWSHAAVVFNQFAVVAQIDRVVKSSDMNKDSEGKQERFDIIIAEGELLDYCVLIESELVSLWSEM